MAQKKESFFWTSFSDLMTSLFFVMLVLFVLTVALLHYRNKATEAQLKKVQEIEKAVESIDPTYFEYRPEYKKHILKIQVNFPAAKSDINYINEDTKTLLIQAGESIKRFVEESNKKYNIQYLLVIEGQASNDRYIYNNELSYERALALKRFWDSNGIDLGSNCEILVSGSGTGGTIREYDERLNQRFLIHIIPKPGIIEASKKLSENESKIL